MPKIDIITEFLTVAKFEGPKAAVERYDKALNKMGSTMRWLGRDYLRLGSTISKVSTFFAKYWRELSKSGLSLSAAFEDISWVVEDIADIIGDQLAPTFEQLANILEGIADFLDRNPGLAWFLGWALLLAVVVPRILGIFSQFVGVLKLFIGAMLMSKKESLSFWQTLKVIGKTLWHHSTAVGKVAAAQYAMGKSQQKGYQITSKLDNAMEHSTDNLTGWWNMSTTTTTGVIEGTEATKEATKATKKQTGRGKKAISTLGGLALAGGAIVSIFGIMGMMLGDNSELFQAFGDALAPVGEFLTGLLEPLIDWIEENPEQGMALILGIVSAIIGMKMLDVFAGLTEVPTTLRTINKNLGDMKTSLGEVTFYAGLFFASFFLIDQLLRALFPNMDPWTRTLIDFGGAILIVSLAMKVNLYDAIISAITNLGNYILTNWGAFTATTALSAGVIFLAAAIGGLVAGLLLGIAILNAVPAEMRPIVGAVMAVVGAIIAATVAWLAFHGAMHGIAAPVVLAIIMAAIGVAIAGVLGMIGAVPHFEKGGIIKAPTVGLLGEAGPEAVVPLKGGGMGMTTEPPMYVTFQVSGTQDPKEFARKAYDELERLKKERMKNKIY